MKKLLLTLTVSVLAISFIFSLQGCLKDSCSSTYTIYAPIYKKLTDVRAEMKSEAARPLENTGKIYVYGQYIFMNEVHKGIHVIDNSNPASPKNISFINIPGNVDIAVKGNYLYADCYSDIVVFDISNPVQVNVAKFLDNAIPEVGYFWGNNTSIDSVEVIVGYSSRDTTVDCDTWQSWVNCRSCLRMDAGGGVFLTNAPAASQQGKGGSMARFSIVNNYMYGVSSYKLYAFDIANPSDPMYTGEFAHVSSCDPVISDGQTAYVTLRSGTECQGFTNQLDVINISNLSNPSLIKTYPMSNPHGLSKDGDNLFICDGKAGLKIYNASDPSSIKLLDKFENLETFDVITMNGLAIVVAKDGLYQYDYSNNSNIRQISRMGISRK